MSDLTELAISGPVLLAALLALVAGAMSFASPCCLPLVPGYLAYLAGLAGLAGTTVPDTTPPAAPDADLPSGGVVATRPIGRARLVSAALLFVAGFTVVFTAGIMGVLGLSDLLAIQRGAPDPDRRGPHHCDGSGVPRTDPAPAA